MTVRTVSAKRVKRSSSASANQRPLAVEAPSAPLVAPPPSRALIVRNYHFSLPPSRILNWHGAGLHATAFNNALSVFFPLGETFFIHAVKRYQHVVEPGSPLEAEVAAFISQEAIHSREHDAYNAALKPYYAIWLLEGILWCVLFPFECVPFLALAGTVALEHLTASLGHLLVSDESLMGESEPHFAELWYWHAVEETEHKGP
jgi:predicted metal-dependent hydrolase